MSSADISDYVDMSDSSISINNSDREYADQLFKDNPDLSVSSIEYSEDENNLEIGTNLNIYPVNRSIDESLYRSDAGDNLTESDYDEKKTFLMKKNTLQKNIVLEKQTQKKKKYVVKKNILQKNVAFKNKIEKQKTKTELKNVVKTKKTYKCKKCGEDKRGHICTVFPSHVVSNSMSARVRMLHCVGSMISKGQHYQCDVCHGINDHIAKRL